MKTIFINGESITFEISEIPGKIWYSFLTETGNTAKPYGTMEINDLKKLHLELGTFLLNNF